MPSTRRSLARSTLAIQISNSESALTTVIASEAKQSIAPRTEKLDCFASLAMTTSADMRPCARDANAPGPLIKVRRVGKSVRRSSKSEGGSVPTIQDETADRWWARREMRLLPTLRSQFQTASLAATTSRSRRMSCARFDLEFSAFRSSEGAGNAGCPMHPQPRVRFVVLVCTRVFTAEAPETSGIPHAMVLTAYT